MANKIKQKHSCVVIIYIMASGGSRHAKSKINAGVNGGELMEEN